MHSCQEARRALPSNDAELSAAAPSPDNAAEANKAMVPQATRMVKDFDPDRQRNVDRWRLEFPICRIPDDSPLLLPEIREEDQGKKCLVLDLDDTLIYTVYSRDRKDADIYFEIEEEVRVDCCI
jgi:TFIIF-interacting CTD phosphatase-like protein